MPRSFQRTANPQFFWAEIRFGLLQSIMQTSMHVYGCSSEFQFAVNNPVYIQQVVDKPDFHLDVAAE
jgi:hypothetical protein